MNCERLINWETLLPGSAYAAEIFGDAVLVGGSTWDRRTTEFNTVTRNSPGRLTRLEGLKRS